MAEGGRLWKKGGVSYKKAFRPPSHFIGLLKANTFAA